MGSGRGVLVGRDRLPVGLEPRYAPKVIAQLDQIEQDPTRVRLWNAICDAVDLICDQPESGEARQHVWRRRDGGLVWQIPLRDTGDDDWAILWFPNGDDANIVYIGPELARVGV